MTTKPIHPLSLWLDTEKAGDGGPQHKVTPRLETKDLIRCIPYLAMHLTCFAALATGVSPVAVAVMAGSFLLRMFAITGFYHRYFSHRSFRTGRFWQFVFAFIGAASVQRGPIWWAAHHRFHHRHSDTEKDMHSPGRFGFLWSHTAWFMSHRHFGTRKALAKDWQAFPELVFLDRYDMLAPTIFALGLFGLGEWLAVTAPGLGTDGWQMLIWGFFISTVLLYHATFTINSLAHGWGSRRFATRDDSRNNWFLALLTLGEGWHNNHHRYPVSTRQGFYWWEIDITWMLLRLLAVAGIVSDLKPVPASVLAEGVRQDAPGRNL